MPTEIITALIAGCVTLITSIGTWHVSARKDREKMREEIKKELLTYHEKNRQGIEEIRNKDLRELRDDVTSMGANLQQKIAVIETNIITLSDRVEKHNGVIEKTYRLEETDKLLDERIRVANHRIEDLEHRVG